MRNRSVSFVWVLMAGVAALALTRVVAAQAPARGGQPATAQGRGAAAQPRASQLHGNLIQVMRGIIYPASNVVFFAQAHDPAAVKVEDAVDVATATDPLMNAYGGWQAVENAAIALSESANLLTIPGRRCSNGRPVPMQDPDWAKFVQGLRDAGMATLKAAQSKNQDAVIEAADQMTTACANCHEKWRDVAEFGAANAVTDRCR